MEIPKVEVATQTGVPLSQLVCRIVPLVDEAMVERTEVEEAKSKLPEV